MDNQPLFHLAFPVTNLDKTREFYCNILGCSTGRESQRWIDFDFFGHQLVCHLSPASISEISNPVDQENVPVPHYGVVLDWNKFEAIIKQLEEKKINFIIKPTIRFKGEVGEQAIAFLRDPSGNAIEFKSFRNMDNLFKAE